jgi:hypothetical protein
MARTSVRPQGRQAKQARLAVPGPDRKLVEFAGVFRQSPRRQNELFLLNKSFNLFQSKTWHWKGFHQGKVYTFDLNWQKPSPGDPGFSNGINRSTPSINHRR